MKQYTVKKFDVSGDTIHSSITTLQNKFEFFLNGFAKEGYRVIHIDCVILYANAAIIKALVTFEYDV